MSNQPARDVRIATFVDPDGNQPCSPPDDCDVCYLFGLPSDEPVFDAWVHRVQNDIRNDPSVIGHRLEERGLLTFGKVNHEH